MKKLKNKGMTLIEMTVVLSIVGAMSATALKYSLDKRELYKTSKFVNEAYNIVKAVDHRIAIDGYKGSLWSTQQWNNSDDISKILIQKELTSVNLPNCNGGTWTPKTSIENETKLIDCKLWSANKNKDKNIKAKLNIDSNGFVEGFDLIISYNSKENFSKEIQNLRYAIRQIEKNPSQQISGSHHFNFVSLSSQNTIEAKDCYINPTNCGFKISLDRDGGEEYIRVDGQNSMFEDHLTFIEAKNNAPLKCVRWKNSNSDGSGTWSPELQEECGIGIYKNGSAISMEVVSDNATFTNILLDKQCSVYAWNGSSVIKTPTVSPCGISNDGTNIYQVSENTVSLRATFKEAYAREIMAANGNIVNLIAQQANINTLDSETGKFEYINVSDNADILSANIDELITPLLNADLINVKKLNVSEDSQFDGVVTFNNTTNFNFRSNFNNDVNFQKMLVDNINANNVTTDNLESHTIISDSGNIKHISSERIQASSNVSSPVGNFDNINADLSDVKSRYNEAKRLWELEKQKNACNDKSNTTYSIRNESCPSGYRGTAKRYYQRDWYWSSSSNTCNYTNTSYRSTSGCTKISSGGPSGGGACGNNSCGGGNGPGGAGGA